MTAPLRAAIREVLARQRDEPEYPHDEDLPLGTAWISRWHDDPDMVPVIDVDDLADAVTAAVRAALDVP